MFRVLKPGGRLILNVAALESLRGNHSVLSGEVRRYSKGDLRRRLEAAGFRVTHSTYTNLSILPMVAAVRLKQRLSGDHVESQEEITVPPAPVNALLSGLLAIEAAALRVVNMPIGSSLLAVAEKPVGLPRQIAPNTGLNRSVDQSGLPGIRATVLSGAGPTSRAPPPDASRLARTR